MGEIFIFAEHRQGALGDSTWELVTPGKELAEATGYGLSAVLMGHGVEPMAKELAEAGLRVIMMDDPRLEPFNSECHRSALCGLMEKHRPFVLLMPHSAVGMELAPLLSVDCGLPLATDCIGVEFREDRLFAVRQLYSSKINARVSLREADGYILTIRPGAFQPYEERKAAGEIQAVDSGLSEDPAAKRFVAYVEAETAEIDISQADVIVSVGRGIGDEEHLPMIESLARAMGAALGCSRPVVDKKWLPKYHQVGTSGVTVKPKIYLALGISGTFQHMGGIKGSPIIIAVNKDPKAPIFRLAHYGVVSDMFKVIPVLEQKIKEAKGG